MSGRRADAAKDVEWTEFVEGYAPLARLGRSDPFSDGASRKPGTLGYLMQRELVAELHPSDFSQHFHADHTMFSCSKIEQKQLSTWSVFSRHNSLYWISVRSAATRCVGRTESPRAGCVHLQRASGAKTSASHLKLSACVLTRLSKLCGSLRFVEDHDCIGYKAFQPL